MHRRTALPKRSAKRIARTAATAPARDAFRREIGRCMWCGAIDWHPVLLVVHEITRGIWRDAALEFRELWLLLCDGPGETCHRIVQDWPLAQQLALKLVRDPWWFSLDRVREVRDNGRHPRIIEMEEVRQAGIELKLCA